MKKAVRKKKDDVRREYDFKSLGPSVRGKYYQQYVEGTNLVLLDPDIAEAFRARRT